MRPAAAWVWSFQAERRASARPRGGGGGVLEEEQVGSQQGRPPPLGGFLRWGDWPFPKDRGSLCLLPQWEELPCFAAEDPEHAIRNRNRGRAAVTLTRRVNVFPHLEQTKAAGTKLGS